jgi:hypothetical protein
MTGPDWVLRFTFVLVVLLVPLVPAYVLFRILKSSATLKGPFQGLTLNLGGAGALYFAIVILLFYTLRPWTAPEARDECWTVKGLTGLESPGPDAEQIFIRVRPPEVDIAKDDTVSFTFPGAIPDRSGNILLIVESKGFVQHQEHIGIDTRDSNRYVYHDDTRVIEVREPLILSRRSDEPEYNPPE